MEEMKNSITKSIENTIFPGIIVSLILISLAILISLYEICK